MEPPSKLFDAIAAGQLDRVRELVEVQPTLASARNESGVSALMMAAYCRQSEIVDLVRTSLAELDVFEAVAVGDEYRLGELLQDRNNATAISPDGFTPLHFAAFFDKPGLASQLLAAGADAHAVADNASQVQPLHSAAASRSSAIVRMLVEHGADANARQQEGWTALQSAAKHGLSDMVGALIEYGADPRQAADDGQTALSLASTDEVRRRMEQHLGK